MKKVFKYGLSVADMQTVELPKGAKVLRVDTQSNGGENLFLWALVNPDEKETESVRIRCAGTGHPIEEENIEYINTVFLFGGTLVLHFFLVK